MRVGIVVTLCVAVAVSACGRSAPTQTVRRSVDIDNAQSVAVTLKIGAVELHVSGGAPKLMDASFRFNVPEWEPAVDYANANGRGTLTIRQPSGPASFGKVENTWDVRFNDSVPISIDADLGAGEAALTLGSLNLQNVSVHEGAGELTLDLRGMPKRSYDVNVDGGVGTATIRLPHSVGIEATPSGGIGGINVTGLTKQGDVWINGGHEHDPVVIHLTAHGAVGEIDISAE